MKTTKIRKPEYLNELPKNIYEYRERYWWDADNNRLLMKDKRTNKYKVVKPMSDKYHESQFIHIYENGKKIYINYDYLTFSYSIGYYLVDIN